MTRRVACIRARRPVLVTHTEKLPIVLVEPLHLLCVCARDVDVVVDVDVDVGVCLSAFASF